MKHLLITLVALSFGVTATAEECSTQTEEAVTKETMVLTTDVPKHLEGATIIVRLKDGRESVVPAEKFKVVPRKQQVIVTATLAKEKTTCSPEDRKNRVSLMAGNGAKEGLDTTKKIDEVTVESRVGIVGGLQYQRKITKRVNLGIQVQSSETVLGSIGLDF